MKIAILFLVVFIYIAMTFARDITQEIAIRNGVKTDSVRAIKWWNFWTYFSKKKENDNLSCQSKIDSDKEMEKIEDESVEDGTMSQMQKPVYW